MDRNSWAVVFISVFIMGLVYFFLTSIFRPNQDRRRHSRVYVDYTEYRHRTPDPETDIHARRRRHPKAHKSAARARQIKQTMFRNVMGATTGSYNEYMKESLKSMPSAVEQQPKPTRITPIYKQVMELSKQAVPGYQVGLTDLTRGDYDMALVNFNKALENADSMDIKNRIDIYGMIAECYYKQGNDEGYIQYRIRQIRMRRRLQEILQEVFPDQQESFEHLDWMSPRQASTNLLRLRSAASRTDSDNINIMIRRAELDQQIARRVSRVH